MTVPERAVMVVSGSQRVNRRLPGEFLDRAGIRKDVSMVESASTRRCSKRHKVLVLDNSFDMGGLEKKLYDFISRIDRNHFDVVICCLKEGGYFKHIFDKMGIRELVENGGSGLLVPPDGEKAISQAAVKLLSDSGRMNSFGKREREIVENQFTLDRMCLGRETLFSSLLCE